jgi:alpha 1,6-mannosyltransferase
MLHVTIAHLSCKQIGDEENFTGLRRMTRSILKSLESVLGDKIEERNIAAIYKPKQIGDVLILPGYSFAATINKYKPEDQQDSVLVTLHFAGSWKNEFGGEVIDNQII